MTYKIEKDETMGMRVPVIIYANDQLLEKMMTDRTLKQAVNVAKQAEKAGGRNGWHCIS